MNKERFCQDLADWPEDKQGMHTFYNPETGAYCAIGWLMEKNGVLAPAEKSGYRHVDIDRVYAVCEEEYDMSATEISEVYRYNDNQNLGGTPKQRVQKEFCGL